MAANVLFIIIPGQRKTVAALLKGEEPDPIWGQIAKQRSIHNNYLTLPVVFTMLSNHYFLHLLPRQVELADPGLHLRRQLPGAALVQHCMHTGAKPDWRLWPAAAVPVLARSSSACRPARAPIAEAGAAAGDLRRREADRRSALPCLPLRQAEVPGLRRGAEGRDVRYPGADQAAGAADHGAGGEDPHHAAGQRHRDHRSGTVGAGVVDRGGFEALNQIDRQV